EPRPGAVGRSQRVPSRPAAGAAEAPAGRARGGAELERASLFRTRASRSDVYSLQRSFMDERLGTLEQLLLLALLRLGEEAPGVPIRDEIEARTGRVLSPGAVYTALDRLERRGLVRSRVGAPTPERGGKRKRHSRLTGRGATTLARVHTSLVQMARGLAPKLGAS